MKSYSKLIYYSLKISFFLLVILVAAFITTLVTNALIVWLQQKLVGYVALGLIAFAGVAVTAIVVFIITAFVIWILLAPLRRKYIRKNDE